MSKNFLNKIYYKVGILDGDSGDIISEYATQLPIINGFVVHKKLMDFMHEVHGDNIIVLLDKREGNPPSMLPKIVVNIPKPNNCSNY